VEGKGDNHEVELRLRVVAEGSCNECEPPQLSETVDVVEPLTVGYLGTFPDLFVHEPKEDLVVSVGVLNRFISADVFLLVSQPQEVKNRVASSQDEGNYRSCCRDAPE